MTVVRFPGSRQASNAGTNPKHVERATQAIARELCTVHFTDGFCSPNNKPDCRCMDLARRCITGMAGVGVIPVWAFDPSGEDDCA